MISLYHFIPLLPLLPIQPTHEPFLPHSLPPPPLYSRANSLFHDDASLLEYSHDELVYDSHDLHSPQILHSNSNYHAMIHDSDFPNDLNSNDEHSHPLHSLHSSLRDFEWNDATHETSLHPVNHSTHSIHLFPHSLESSNHSHDHDADFASSLSLDLDLDLSLDYYYFRIIREVLPHHSEFHSLSIPFALIPILFHSLYTFHFTQIHSLPFFYLQSHPFFSFLSLLLSFLFIHSIQR